MNRRQTHATGFTLVEMLAVILVIAILVAVVVGVAGIVIRRAAEAETKMTMEVIRTAIDVHYEVNSDFPGEVTNFGAPPVGWSQRNWEACKRGGALYGALMGCEPAKQRLSPLKSDAIKAVYGGNKAFIDGFGKYMDYFKTAGAGGKPLVLSAGGDGDFNTTEDNVRSDKL